MGDYSTPVLPTPDGYSPLRSMAEATLPYSSASVSAPGGTEEGGTRSSRRLTALSRAAHRLCHTAWRAGGDLRAYHCGQAAGLAAHCRLWKCLWLCRAPRYILLHVWRGRHIACIVAYHVQHGRDGLAVDRCHRLHRVSVRRLLRHLRCVEVWAWYGGWWMVAAIPLPRIRRYHLWRAHRRRTMGHERHVRAVHVVVVSAVVRRVVRRVVCACVRSSSKLLLLWLKIALLILTPTTLRILCYPLSRVWIQSAPALWGWRWWRGRQRRVVRQRRLVFLRCRITSLSCQVRH